jgi:general secretion pathway protein I
VTARGRRGMTLLEVLVALVVLATGIVALERLIAGNTAAIATDGELTRAMLAARGLLAEAALAPPEPGHAEGDLASRGAGARDLRFTRDVRPTPHPALREVRVRVFPASDAAAGCELVELVRVPAS